MAEVKYHTTGECYSCRSFDLWRGVHAFDGKRVHQCTAGHDVVVGEGHVQYRDCFRPIRPQLVRRHEYRDNLQFCKRCGAFLWHYNWVTRSRVRFVSKHGVFCSVACMHAEKQDCKDKHKNPLNIDMTLDTTPGRSTCAVFVCDIVNRARDKILDNLRANGGERARIVAETNKIRVTYLKAIKCMPNHKRNVIAAGLVYAACKALDIPATQDDVARAARCSSVSVRSSWRDISEALK